VRQRRRALAQRSGNGLCPAEFIDHGADGEKNGVHGRTPLSLLWIAGRLYPKVQSTETEDDMDDWQWARMKLETWLVVICARIEQGLGLPQDLPFGRVSR
jgi:hypothetical protein